MKLCNPNLLSLIEISENHVNEIIIENQRLFRELLEDISLAIGGSVGKTILSKNNTPLDMAKFAQIINEFAPLQLNKKTLITKITQLLEKESLNEINYAYTMGIISNLEKYLYELSLDLPCEVSFPKLNIGNIIKSASPDILEEGKSALESLFDYMELVRELEREKLFIFVNMRSYFNDEEMVSFINTCLSHHHKILLLESQARDVLLNTKRLIIDKDLCEI